MVQGLGPLTALVFFVSADPGQPQRPITGGFQEVGIEGKDPMKLAIRITQERNGTYRACCPSLPGCRVCGETREGAHAKINAAVQGYLASLDVCLPRELGRALAIEMA